MKLFGPTKPIIRPSGTVKETVKGLKIRLGFGLPQGSD